MTRGFRHAANLFDISARLFDPNNVRVRCQLNYRLCRHVVGREDRHTVDQQRNRGAVRHRSIKRQQICWLHLGTVEVRRANKRNIVTKVSSKFREVQRFYR